MKKCCSKSTPLKTTCHHSFVKIHVMLLTFLLGHSGSAGQADKKFIETAKLSLFSRNAWNTNNLSALEFHPGGGGALPLVSIYQVSVNKPPFLHWFVTECSLFSPYPMIPYFCFFKQNLLAKSSHL